MALPLLPETMTLLKPEESFCFQCHKDIACFTHCCRQLELALTPYDVLRLRQATGLHSRELLENYIVIDHQQTDAFPHYYLTMVDDGEASCVFVTDTGCAIYRHRPGACRTYPMGRGVTRKEGGIEETFVLVKEPHCLGFAEKAVQTIDTYSKSQELQSYNSFNDMLTEILQHRKIRSGLKPSADQVADYQCALYDIDTFRQNLTETLVPEKKTPVETLDDEALLAYAFRWLENRLFGSCR